MSTEGAALGGATATVRDIDITGDPQAPFWHFVIAGLFAVAGTFGGARFAPTLRRRLIEEQILLGAITVLVAGALFAALSGGLFGTLVFAGTLSAASVTGKLAFDSLVQRDAPAANYGRSFARFEARFQLAFAMGAMLPVVIRLSIPIGTGLVGTVGGLALLVYVFGNPGRLFKLRSRDRPDRGTGRADSPPWSRTEFDEELRPSQPAPPAGTSDFLRPKSWYEGTPYISSIDGVEVAPIPPPDPPAEPRDPDDPTRD